MDNEELQKYLEDAENQREEIIDLLKSIESKLTTVLCRLDDDNTSRFLEDIHSVLQDKLK